MSNSTTSGIGNYSLPVGASRRRRLAAWVLLGFASLWLATGFAQLCCIVLVAGNHGAAATAQQMADRSVVQSAGAHQRVPDCPEVATPDAVPPPADVASDGYGRAPGTPLPSGYAASSAASLILFAHDEGSLAPPRVPLYLRNQRLLI